jgi:hypothetical protein
MTPSKRRGKLPTFHSHYGPAKPKRQAKQGVSLKDFLLGIAAVSRERSTITHSRDKR